MGDLSKPVADANDGRKEKRKAFLTWTLLLHVVMFAYWVFAHVHESSLTGVAESVNKEEYPGLRFPRALEFPGRWRFLTLVNMVSTQFKICSRDTCM